MFFYIFLSCIHIIGTYTLPVPRAQNKLNLFTHTLRQTPETAMQFQTDATTKDIHEHCFCSTDMIILLGFLSQFLFLP